VATGVVVRFDSRRGYGFLAPDDGGEDVFVHQNNINMEGFRHLQVGERVSYELEVGEKGMKAVSVTLLEPRAPRPPRSEYDNGDRRDDQGGYERGRSARRDDHEPSERRADNGRGAERGGDLQVMVDKMRRKQERLISLLVEKGVLAPGEIDGLAAAGDAAAASG